MSKVIVFGPTGGVGSYVALIAHQQGAQVVLAMRDTSKSIPGLSAESERAGEFERVNADLTQPDTLTAAVKSTGATRAFIYAAFGTPDHMKSSLEALKAAGITHVVFLSSFTVSVDPAVIPQREILAWVHGQVELSLEAVFGADHFAAIRPGGFATNIYRYKQGIIDGHAKFYKPDYEFDYITPETMGRVAGFILVHGPKKGKRLVYIAGAKLITQREAIGIIGKVLGRDIKVSDVSQEEELEHSIAAGVPPPIAQYINSKLSVSHKSYSYGFGPLPEGFLEECQANVKLYTGDSPNTFEDWVEANKESFTA